MENKQLDEQLVNADSILEATKKEHKKGAQRLKALKRTTAIVSIIGLAIGFYSSIFHLPGQTYDNTDKNVASAFSEDQISQNQEQLKNQVSEKVINSIFQPVYIYEDESYHTGGTGFAIEELTGIDEDFKCITTLVQSHGDSLKDVMIRLPNTNEDIIPSAQIIRRFPHDMNLYGSGWDFVALCFEGPSIDKINNLSYVGTDSIGEYNTSPQEQLVSIGLPSVLEKNNIPQIFLSEHLPYTSNMIIGGEASQGESGGILFSKTRQKIVGTILSGPPLKNSIQIQSISNLDSFIKLYDEVKQEALKLWGAK
jgi:hypothetical protein